MTTVEEVSFSFLLYQFNTVGIAFSHLRDFLILLMTANSLESLRVAVPDPQEILA